MSTYEYDDMYREAQKNGGQYYMRVIDIMDSRNLNPFEYIAFVQKSKDIERKYSNIIKRYQLGDAIGYLARTGDEDYVNLAIILLMMSNKDLYFHDAAGYCDTLEWAEGDKLYYAGYLFDKLSTLHKQKIE